MKKIFTLSLLLLSFMVLASCSDNDNKTGIHGTWECFHRELDVEASADIKTEILKDLNSQRIEIDWITFKPNNTYYIGRIAQPQSKSTYVLDGEYLRLSEVVDGELVEAVYKFKLEGGNMFIYFDRTDFYKANPDFETGTITKVLETGKYGKRTVNVIE